MMPDSGYSSLGFYERFGKRAFDLFLTMPGLCVALPLMGVIALFVRFFLGKPVLFRQPRPGRGERLFTMLKFRTMTDARDETDQLLPDSQRLLPLGRFLRRSSLDELPSLFNVAKGEMSLVGPRPLLTRYLPYFTVEERARFLVRPGVTGMAQISGRNDLSWDARLAADIVYVRDCSFWLDSKILFLTVGRVLTRSGLREDPESGPMLNFDDERKLRAQQKS